MNKYIIDVVPNPSSKTRIEFVKENENTHTIDFDAKEGSITVQYTTDKDVNWDTITLIYVGVGEGNTDKLYEKATSLAIAKAIELKRADVAIKVPAGYSFPIAEMAVRATYRFDKYKTEKDHEIELVELYGETIEQEIEHGVTLGESVNFARNLQNDNAGLVVPEYLVEQALAIANSCDLFEVEVLYEDNIKEKGLNLLWAVGQGSPTPPRLIILNYKGDEHSEERVALVGKGVTFDSGGLSLKPSASMVDMRMDMSGASAVLGAIKFLAEVQPEINVIGVIPTAHNAIGNEAFYLGDTIKSYNGKTVEILNTDAEGRLILADAISYVARNYHPSEIIDMATLTGAIVVALGSTVAGIFSNNDDLAEEIFQAGEHTQERVWRLPIYDEHRKAMKGKFADLRNISNIGRNCGSITASAFLEEFVEDIPWCHIDIAGTSHNEKEGGTGWGVDLLVNYLLR